MIKLILKLLSFLPLRLSHNLGHFIGWCLWFFNTKIKTISQKNINLCLKNLTQAEKEKVLKQSLIETGKTFTEVSKVWFNSTKKILNKTSTNDAHLLNNDQVTIFLMPHLGCWEIIGPFLAKQNKTTFFYKPLSNKKFDDLLVKTRESRGYKLASANKKGVIKLQKAILKNEWLGILPDQNPGAGNGLNIDFFDKKVSTMTLLVKLARKNNVQIISSWAERLPKAKGYLIHFEKVNFLSQTNLLEDDCLLMNQTIEKMILQKPEQYQWSYNRFKL